MPCERYQAALIDLAISGEEPNGDLRAHLDRCISCAALANQDASLLAAIENGLRQVANVEVPASLLLGVQRRLAEEPRASVARNVTWIYGLAAAAILVVVTFPFLWPRSMKEPTILLGAKPRHAEEKGSALPPPQRPDVATPTVARISQPSGKRATSTAEKGEPEVLVPPEEREALEHFVSNVQRPADLAVALVIPASDRKTEPLNVDPLQIARLEMKPLEDEGVRGSEEANF